MSRTDRNALLSLVGGFSVWSVGFVALYGIQALGCAYGWPEHRVLLMIAYGVIVVALALLARRAVAASGEPSSSLALSALWANRAALAAGVLVFLPVTFTSACT